MTGEALIFPALPEYVGKVRSALGTFLQQAGVDTEAISDLKAAVSEACANVVRYAYTDKPGNMEIKFELDAQGVTVSITDYGCGFDPENPPLRPLDDDDIHLGIGLQMMRDLVDEMTVQSNAKGTVVTLLKKGKWLC